MILSRKKPFKTPLHLFPSLKKKGEGRGEIKQDFSKRFQQLRCWQFKILFDSLIKTLKGPTVLWEIFYMETIELMTVADLATVLKKAVKTVYHYVETEYIPASIVMKFGNEIRINKCDFEKWVVSRKGK